MSQGKKKRGFACMSAELRTAIATKGGAAVPAEKRTFFMNRSLAAKAGRVGGKKSRPGGSANG